MKRLTITALWLTVPLALGCNVELDDEGSGPDARSVESFRMQGAVVDVLDSGELIRERILVKGREFRWQGKVVPRPVRPTGVAALAPVIETEQAIEDVTEAELAEALRGASNYQGHAYVEVAPNWTAARRAKAYNRSLHGGATLGELQDILSGSAAFDADAIDATPEDVRPRMVIGTDNRTVMNNTAYPHRTHVVWDHQTGGPTIGESRGTATIIGPSTALSAAHVFWDAQITNNWYPVQAWAPGYDSQDGTKAPFGTWHGCYFVTIPSSFTTTELPTWDFAVIDFNVPCNLGNDFIGNATSWLGTWIPSTSQISGNPLHVKGYPKPGNCGSPPTACNTRVWGHSASNSLLSGTTIFHDVDTTNGQSGAAAYINFDPPGAFGKGDYLVGIHTGASTTSNRARKFDSTVHSFLVTYSDDF